jgi:hypothetical protein
MTQENKVIQCTNENCVDGIVEVVYGEKQFCGICDGEGVIDETFKQQEQ